MLHDFSWNMSMITNIRTKMYNLTHVIPNISLVSAFLFKIIWKASLCHRPRHFNLSQLVWALQEFSARNFELVPLLCASGERLAPLVLGFRSSFARTLAPSALRLALRARSWVYHAESSLWQRLMENIKSATSQWFLSAIHRNILHNKRDVVTKVYWQLLVYKYIK